MEKIPVEKNKEYIVEIIDNGFFIPIVGLT